MFGIEVLHSLTHINRLYGSHSDISRSSVNDVSSATVTLVREVLFGIEVLHLLTHTVAIVTFLDPAVRTVQYNYNITHAFCLMRGAHVFQRGQGNNHACTYKFTQLQNTHDSYTGHFHVCAIYFLCASKLVIQLMLQVL